MAEENVGPLGLRLVHISDTHNQIDKIEIPNGDILVHSGDFSNRGQKSEVEKFNEFLGTLPHRYKIVIAGNHDLMENMDLLKMKKILTNCTHFPLFEEFYIEGLKFYGMPWQANVHTWNFQFVKSGAEKLEKWDQIPDNLDFLITHGPPYGICDFTQEKTHAGSQGLRKAVKSKTPKYHLFGHIHTAYGRQEINGIQFINASICNYKGKAVNAPVVLDL